MAYRLNPISALPATANYTWPDIYWTDSNDFQIEGLGVAASLGGDAELHYVWLCPPSLPTGNAKLELIGFCHSGSGNAAINPKWASFAFDEDFDVSEGSLNAEGEEVVTWGGSDDNKFKRVKVDLDADTVVADEFIQMRLDLVSANWTLNTRSIWLPSIIWE
jgi:hypothetical protein